MEENKEEVKEEKKIKENKKEHKKRDFRKLWITRINAACRENNISYSKFINGLSKAGVEINRKMLSEIAIDNPAAFAEIVNVAKAGLEGKAVQPKEAKKVEKKETKGEEEVKAQEKAEEVKAPVEKKTAKKTSSKSKKAESEVE